MKKVKAQALTSSPSSTLDADKKSNPQPKPAKVQTQGNYPQTLPHLPFLFQRVAQLEPRKILFSLLLAFHSIHYI